MSGDHRYMRCVAYFVNMMVSEGLKEISSSVAAVRGAVRYVLQSPIRLRNFKACVEIDNIESKKALCLDVPGRWNTTFMMLDAAEKYERAFMSYKCQDSNFEEDFLSEENSHGVPNASDWGSVRKMVEVLKLFYEMTVSSYGNLHVTSNAFFLEVCTVDSVLQEWKNSEDIELSSLAVRMKSMWDKYWVDSKEINMTIFISAVLDPTKKLLFVQFVFIRYYGETRGRELAEMVKEATYKLFNEYKRLNSLQLPKKNIGSAPTKAKKLASFVDGHGRIRGHKVKLAFKKFKSETYDAVQKSELHKYLAEDIWEDEQFDILCWWKDNQSRFPVLSEMARDVLAVPVSTLTSESAFSMGDRVFDAFCSSLTPRMTQAVICTRAQDWLRHCSSCTRSGSIGEDVDSLDEMENELPEFGDNLDEMENELPEFGDNLDDLENDFPESPELNLDSDG